MDIEIKKLVVLIGYTQNLKSVFWLLSTVKIFTPTRVNPIERMTDANPSWLISECIAGNEAAIEMFVRQYQTSVFRLALSIVGDPAEANEITQETFLAALHALPTYKENRSFKAWLYTIALNHSRSHLRKRKIMERLRTTLTTIFKIETEKQISPEEAAIQGEREAQIWSALNRLDERQRTVVVLRYFHEFSIAEISEILSVNEGTIHSRLHNAREKLREALKNWHGE
ncbi:MAG TPA: RNA polymerase sigma factor [Anaerolineales bacterium]|nr:RNA polymerase sigma factor [Anaerolineales bacterium]